METKELFVVYGSGNKVDSITFKFYDFARTFLLINYRMTPSVAILSASN